METKVDQIEEQLKFMETGDVILTYVRPVAGEKFSVEIAESFLDENQNNVLSLLNEDDDRFLQSGSVRRGWTNASKEMLKKYLKIDIDNIEMEERVFNSGNSVMVYPIGKKNPSIQGKALRLRIRERLTSELNPSKPYDEWKLDNVKRAAKQDGQGNYLLYHGELIFSETEITNQTEFEHIKIQHNGTTTDPESIMIPAYQIEEEEEHKVPENVEN